MSRAVVILNTLADRQKAANWCMKIKAGTTVTFKENKRSIPQNDYMHAILSELASQLTWHGKKLDVDDWKKVFLSGLKSEMRLVPNLDGTGFVNLTRTSDLTKDECADLITIIQAFGAAHGVKFNEPDRSAA